MVLGLGPNGFARLGGGFPLPLLFDNWIGRKRDVGGGVLAGLGCRVGFIPCERGAGLGDGSPKRPLTVTFRNSSRLGGSGSERREADWLCDWPRADVFGTRQECRGSASFSGENEDVLANENEDVFVK